MTQLKKTSKVESELDITKTVVGDCTKESNKTKNYSISANHTINRSVNATEKETAALEGKVAANATLGKNAFLNTTADATSDNIDASGVSKNSTRDTTIVPNKNGVKKNVTITRSLTNITVSCPNSTNASNSSDSAAESTAQVKSAVKATPALVQNSSKPEASGGYKVQNLQKNKKQEATVSLAQVSAKQANISVDVKVTSNVGNATTSSSVTPILDTNNGNAGASANANGNATASIPGIIKEVAPKVEQVASPVVEQAK